MKIFFPDHPDFQPNISPQQMFKIGIMGGCYFRPITSPDTHKTYNRRHLKYKFLKNIPLNKYARVDYDKSINLYKVQVGTSYEFWMKKGWIREDVDPYGWIEWYCNFWQGRRTPDDLRQIKRWKNIAGVNGRFRKQLQNKINKLGVNDDSVYIRMRQTLLHWGVDTRLLKPNAQKI